jgi:hypothetical protein
VPPPGYYRFSVFHRPAGQVSRLVPAFFRGLRDSSGRILRSRKEEFSGRGNSGGKARPMLTLLLVGAPFGVLGLLVPPSWFLNWPTAPAQLHGLGQ